MSYTAKDLVAIAVAEIGYKEKASNSSLDSDSANAGSANYTKYARDLAAAGYYNGNKNGYAWCDVFVDWCFYQLTGKNKTEAEALECQTGTLGAGCVYSKKYYQAAGRLDSTPKVGDQVFFQSGGTVSHTGIVETVTSSKITTVEGNSGNQVKRNTYSRSDSYIDSYGHPKYVEDSSSSSSGTGSSTSSTSSSTVTEKKATDAARSGPISSLAGTYKVTADSGLNMRNGAGTGKKVMVALPNGTKVQNYGYYTNYNGVKWLYCVATLNGVKYTGFCCSTYLKKQ